MAFMVFPHRRDLSARRTPAFRRTGRPGALLALALSATMPPAHAGRPLATDDAAIVDRGACQLETWIERPRDGRGTWFSPGCNPFGRTEFSLGGARLRDADGAGVTVEQWQIKQLLRGFDASQAGFAVAIGGQRLRDGDARETLVSGIATLPVSGAAHLLHVNLGTLREKDALGRRSRATWGLAYDAEVARSTHAALEAFGTSGERANWQLGLRHEIVPGHVQIDASLGSAIGRWSDTRVVTAGLVFVSPALLP